MSHLIIALSGSTGFIGSKLIAWFRVKKYQVIPILREDFLKGPEWIASKIVDCHAVVHLAGSPVIRRWHKKARREILESRINTTGIMAEAFKRMDKAPELFVCASGIGIYDKKNIHTEESMLTDHGFLASVVKEWEKSAQAAGKWVKRVVHLRIGIVISADGGATAKVISMFRYGLGAYLGTGKQKMAFIHIDDLCRAIELIFDNNQLEGVVNCVAPVVTDNREYSKELAGIFGWKHIFYVPSFFLRLRFGQAADLLLEGEHVLPEKLLKFNFNYIYPDIKSAVKSLLNE